MHNSSLKKWEFKIGRGAEWHLFFYLKNKIVKYIFLITSFCLSITSYAQTKISNTEAFQKINKGKVQLVDVRTTEEYSKKHLENSIHINWNDKENFDALTQTLNKKKPVYVYCLSGGRSTKAAQYLAQQGFEVYDIEGGIMKWEAANLPIINQEKNLSGLSLKEYKALVKSHPLILIDFYAEWCAPCKEMSPIIDQIASTHKESVKVIKINTDENSTLIKQLGISGIPKLYIYKNGKQRWTRTGLTDLETLEKALK
jgi:thioredoxin 1